jgi:hypothetical protein
MRAAGEGGGGYLKLQLESAWNAMQKALGKVSPR